MGTRGTRAGPRRAPRPASFPGAGRLRAGSIRYRSQGRRITDAEWRGRRGSSRARTEPCAPMADGVGDDYKALFYKRLREEGPRAIEVEQVCIAVDDTRPRVLSRRAVHGDRPRDEARRAPSRAPTSSGSQTDTRDTSRRKPRWHRAATRKTRAAAMPRRRGSSWIRVSPCWARCTTSLPRRRRKTMGTRTEALAIAGGQPLLRRADYRNWPVITADDRRLVNEVLDSGIVAGGTAPMSASLEKEWAAYVGSRHCLTTVSGTAALHMALAACGIGPGDEVITSAFTFLASASCALHQNAHPGLRGHRSAHLLHGSRRSSRRQSRSARRRSSPCTSRGCPRTWTRSWPSPKKHKLFVIEDACQAHGAEYKGRKVGTIGDIGTFSLNNIKNLCGGEGGLFVTDDERPAEKGVLIRCFGDEVDEVSHRRIYNASILGYMYRNQELPAALARGPADAPGREQRDTHRQCRIPDAGAREDPRRHPALLPAGVQARVLDVQRALRPEGGRRRRHAAEIPHRRGEGAVQGRPPHRPVADDAGAGAGPLPEQARLRRLSLPVVDQRGQGHPLRL